MPKKAKKTKKQKKQKKKEKRKPNKKGTNFDLTTDSLIEEY